MRGLRVDRGVIRAGVRVELAVVDVLVQMLRVDGAGPTGSITVMRDSER